MVVAGWFAVVAWQSGHSVWITASLYGSFHLFAVLVQSASRDAEKAKEEGRANKITGGRPLNKA